LQKKQVPSAWIDLLRSFSCPANLYVRDADAAPGGHGPPADAAPGGHGPPADAAPGGHGPSADAAPGGHGPPADVAPGGHGPSADAAPGGHGPPTFTDDFDWMRRSDPYTVSASVQKI